MRLLILSFLITSYALAQDKPVSNPHPLDLGLDISKLLPFSQEAGVILEPFAYGTIKNDFRWRAACGFADVNFGKIYSNLNYRTKGYYVKGGVGKQFFDWFELSLNTVYSTYDEIGNVKFTGPVYGDLFIKRTQRQTLWGLELQSDIFLQIHKHWWIDIQYRISAILSDFNDEYFSPYFAPGFGMLQIGKEKSSAKEKPNSVTAGLSIRIVYRF